MLCTTCAKVRHQTLQCSQCSLLVHATSINFTFYRKRISAERSSASPFRVCWNLRWRRNIKTRRRRDGDTWTCKTLAVILVDEMDPPTIMFFCFQFHRIRPQILVKVCGTTTCASKHLMRTVTSSSVEPTLWRTQVMLVPLFPCVLDSSLARIVRLDRLPMGTIWG